MIETDLKRKALDAYFDNLKTFKLQKNTMLDNCFLIMILFTIIQNLIM